MNLPKTKVLIVLACSASFAFLLTACAAPGESKSSPKSSNESSWSATAPSVNSSPLVGNYAIGSVTIKSESSWGGDSADAGFGSIAIKSSDNSTQLTLTMTQCGSHSRNYRYADDQLIPEGKAISVDDCGYTGLGWAKALLGSSSPISLGTAPALAPPTPPAGTVTVATVGTFAGGSTAALTMSTAGYELTLFKTS